MEKNYFQTLNEVNVNEHIEKKGDLSYLSWAYAWQEVKLRFPDATYVVYENTLPNGYVVNYFTDGRYAYVKTGVTINGIEHIEYLPIMDYKNNSIPLDKITSFNVNTAIQRSLTKAVARHGLGLYVYAGEDLPQVESEKETTEKKSISAPTTKPFVRDLPSNNLQDTDNISGSITEEQQKTINSFLDSLTDDKRITWFNYFDKNFGTKKVSEFSRNQASSIVQKIVNAKAGAK